MFKILAQNINKYLLKSLLIVILTIFSFPIIRALNRIAFNNAQGSVQKVFAEDDEDEEEEEDDEDESDDDYEETIVNTTTESQQVTPAPQVEYVWVPTGAYAIDTDDDGLVDAIDPDPNIPQQQYFTDTDGDGVADLTDKYPGENDFMFVDDTDLNSNGIWDTLEN